MAPNLNFVEMARVVIASSSFGILTLDQLYQRIALQYPNAVNGLYN